MTRDIEALLKPVFKAAEKAYKYKVPTEKFLLVQDVIKSIEQFMDKDDKLELDYDMGDLTVYVQSDFFGISPKKMPEWIELMNKVDSLDITLSFDEKHVSLAFAIHDIFKPA